MTQKFELTGKIIKIYQDKDFKKIVLEHVENEKYTQKSEFSLSKSVSEIINKFKEGDEVRVSFNIRTNEWIDKKGEIKNITSLSVWRIKKIESDDEKTCKEVKRDLAQESIILEGECMDILNDYTKLYRKGNNFNLTLLPETENGNYAKNDLKTFIVSNLDRTIIENIELKIELEIALSSTSKRKWINNIQDFYNM